MLKMHMLHLLFLQCCQNMMTFKVSHVVYDIN